MAFFIDDDSPRRRKSIPKLIKQALYDNQKGKCMYCGMKLRIADMHIDHKNPVKRGGSDSPSNLHLLCQTCNTRKGAMTDGQFRRAYKSVGLLPAREANGRPPGRVIPLSKFEQVSKTRSNKKAKARRKERDDWW